MNKEKAIEEMVSCIERAYHIANESPNSEQLFADIDISRTIAEHLYDIGYRKPIEISQNNKEKAKKLIENLDDAYNAYYDTSRGMPYDIDETLRESKILIQELLKMIEG